MSLRKNMIIVTIISSIATIFVGCTDISEKIQKNLNENHYDKAVKEVLLSQNKDKEKYTDLLINSAYNIKEKFLHREVDGTLAISNLNKLKKVKGMEEHVDPIIEEIRLLMNSRKAFENGIRLEKEQNYGEALDSYYYVNKDDIENYEEAKNKVAKISKYLSENSVVEISESKVLVSKSNDKNSIPDQMQVIVKNKSSKTITSIDITIIGFDKDNNRVRIQGKNSDVNEYVFLGIAEDIKINGNSFWGEKNAWQLDGDCKVNSISACIQKVEFIDGEVWENPLYNSWINENSIE